MHPNTRILRLYRLDPPGQVPDTVRFGGADVDVTAVDLPQRLKLLLRFIHHVQDFLRPFAKEIPLLCQPDAEAAADKELFPQLALQILELLGQGRLGDVKPLGGAGNAALPGHGKKISQNTDLHKTPPAVSIAGGVILFKNNMI